MKRIKDKVNNTLRRFSRVDPAPPAKSTEVAVREVITGDPFLPPELEREIFVLVAVNDPVDGWTHQHVGDMVLVLPQSFNGGQPVPRFLATIDTRPASFFALHVKYLYFDYTVPLPAVQRVLSVCTGVVSVGCHHPYLSLAPLLAPLPLQRLCVSEFALPSTPADLPPWAVSLTELGLTQSLPPDSAAALAALPALTHLAVDFEAVPNPVTPGMGTALAQLLAASPHLRCLVFMTSSKSDYRWAYERLRKDAFGDARLHVHLRPIPDGTWDAWSRRVPDVFVEAEEALERRRVAAAARAGR